MVGRVFSKLCFLFQYDIVLDVLIVNQTSDTLQSCTLELATLGDLKLVERPQPVVLAPMDFCRCSKSLIAFIIGFFASLVGATSFSQLQLSRLS